MIERTSMFSETPATPGRRQQMPRTFSSTCTPAWLARYRARQISGSCSELTLAMISPGRSGVETWISRSIRSMKRCRRPVGRDGTASASRRPREQPVRRLKKAATSVAMSRSAVIRPMSE